MRVVFDLDGTLALDEHRVHHLNQSPKDWDAYFEACDGDEPNVPIVALFLRLMEITDFGGVQIWSGRSEAVRTKTRIWLATHVVAAQWKKLLKMRPEGDYTPDVDLKRRWLNEARADGWQPEIVFDDRQKVVDMWRAEGIACCQVAPGNF